MPPAKRPAPVTDFLAGWSSAHYTARPAAPASERMQPLELLISREALGVTRKILADALEVSVSSIRAWESGHPTISKGVRRDVEHLEAYTEALTAQLTVRRTTGTSTIGIYTRDGELSELDLPDAPP